MSSIALVFTNRKVLHKGLNIFQSALHFYAYVIKQISMVVENNVGVLYRCLSVSSRYQLISVRQLLIINTPPIIQSNKLTVKSPSSCPPVIQRPSINFFFVFLLISAVQHTTQTLLHTWFPFKQQPHCTTTVTMAVETPGVSLSWFRLLQFDGL